MQEDTIIQKNLFAIGNENNEQEEITNIQEDLSLEDLKKESKNRHRQRKNSTNLINQFKTDLISNTKTFALMKNLIAIKQFQNLN